MPGLLVIHAALASRRVHGGRRLPTMLREVVLLPVYGVTVTIALPGIAAAPPAVA